MSPKITSPADLLALQEKAKSDIGLRSGPKEIKITVHMGTCGIAAGARGVLAGFLTELGNAGVDNASLHQTGCAGLCEEEPMATIADPAGEMYRYGLLDGDKVRRIVQEHVVGGTPVADYLINF
jgi:NADP-reducing hydrogenase subunit HndB